MDNENPKTDLVKISDEEYNNVNLEDKEKLDFNKYDDIKTSNKKNKKGLLGIFALVGTVLLKLKVPLLLFLSKFKFILAALKFGKFSTTFFSMFITIFLYAKLYGFAFGIGFVILILIHELGHFLTAKYLKLDVTSPVFIPFVGALIAMKEPPKDSITETKVAFGGPILGSIASAICFYIGTLLNSGLLLSLSLIGFIINIFNLIPIHPMDGGRIVKSISPKLWFIGIPVLILLMLFSFSPIILLIIILGIKQVIDYKKTNNNKYYDVPSKLRKSFGILYFSLIGIIGFFIFYINSLLVR